VQFVQVGGDVVEEILADHGALPAYLGGIDP
jgi:hypothetical protein